MRTSKHAVGGFAAGLFIAIAIGSMLGLKQPSGGAAEGRRVNQRVEALLKLIDDAEDQVAAAETQAAFWRQEIISQDEEVKRLTGDGGPCAPYFLDRAKGLSTRAAHSFLDSRLQHTLSVRRVQALRSELIKP